MVVQLQAKRRGCLSAEPKQQSENKIRRERKAVGKPGGPAIEHTRTTQPVIDRVKKIYMLDHSVGSLAY